MSTPTVQSGNSMLAPAPAVVEDPSKHWTRHGPVLTACLVGINLLMVLLIFFYFWRFFSGKRGPLSSSSSSTMAGGGDEEEGASSSADTSPAAASPGRHQQDREDVASSLPVFVYSSSAASDAGDAGDAGRSGKVAAECAVCIVEFRDGDRARLLPRCGHRFHADCVGAWLQLHSTCPLCRATVLLPAAASSEPAKNEPKDDDCPV